MHDLKPYLEPNFFVDADHSAVTQYALEHSGDGTPAERAVRLYYAIRDGFRYNPWRVKIDPAGFKASTVPPRRRSDGAHCIDKANLLAACARAIGVPARLHFANVRNHIGTEELERKLGTDLLVFHGYTELHLGGNGSRPPLPSTRGCASTWGSTRWSSMGRATRSFSNMTALAASSWSTSTTTAHTPISPTT